MESEKKPSRGKDSQQLKGLIDITKTQVFLLTCPANVPVNFAVHPWFVCNQKGILSRWEVRFTPNKEKSLGYLHHNYLEPFKGIEKYPFTKKFNWKPTLIGEAEGTLAADMIKVITESKNKYPFIQLYSLLGPNSNTYVQWILDQFGKFEGPLPWNAIGKNYKMQQKDE